MIILFRKAQEFSFHNFQSLQIKLYKWLLPIHNCCTILQARHTHTYLNVKDTLKTEVKNTKKNIKGDVKTDLILYLLNFDL
jgi:hypothetical protein